MRKLPLELEFGLKGEKSINEFEIRFKNLSMRNCDWNRELIPISMKQVLAREPKQQERTSSKRVS